MKTVLTTHKNAEKPVQEPADITDYLVERSNKSYYGLQCRHRGGSHRHAAPRTDGCIGGSEVTKQPSRGRNISVKRGFCRMQGALPYSQLPKASTLTPSMISLSSSDLLCAYRCCVSRVYA